MCLQQRLLCYYILILSPQQHGFVSKKSTATAVFDMLKNVYQNWNNKCYTLCTFVDFSHAFDTIDHQILLRKLKQYGFDYVSLKFISSYLGSRRQFTVVNGHTSECQKVTYGIAQGSIVGPLIYILYANDIFNEINDPNAILMYADDTLLLSKGKSVPECEEHGQGMLNILSSWCDLNKLTINVKKTKSMIIKPCKERVNLNLFLHDEKLDVVNSFEYLGIHIDNCLTMNNHVDSIHKKCITKLGMLYKIRGFISQDTSLLIYKTMIRPYMDYGDFVVDSAHVSKVDKLDRIQERIVRLIEYCPLKENREDINALLKRYNLESLRTRRKRSLLNLMYDQSHKSGNVDIKLCNINLRSAKKVRLKSQFTRLTKVQKSPYYRGLALWDDLPDQIQTQTSRIKFKGDIKRYSFK